MVKLQNKLSHIKYHWMLMVRQMALFPSQENFVQDSVTVIFHRADSNYCHGQMNWDVIELHGFHTDTSSNGLFEALGCIIPQDYKVLEPGAIH